MIRLLFEQLAIERFGPGDVAGLEVSLRGVEECLAGDWPARGLVDAWADGIGEQQSRLHEAVTALVLLAAAAGARIVSSGGHCVW